MAVDRIITHEESLIDDVHLLAARHLLSDHAATLIRIGLQSWWVHVAVQATFATGLL